MGNETSTLLSGKTVAFLATNGVEQPELTQPWEAVKNAGGTPKLISPQDDHITAMKGDWDHADSFPVDQPLAQAHAADYDALVLPGGTINADTLRIDTQAQRLVREFAEAGKPMAAICHAPWILIETDQVRGRRMTSYEALTSDLRNAGANWVDEQVVVDGTLTTSRNPGDLDAFCATFVREFAHK